jgi:hypothetical protein
MSIGSTATMPQANQMRGVPTQISIPGGHSVSSDYPLPGTSKSVKGKPINGTFRLMAGSHIRNEWELDANGQPIKETVTDEYGNPVLNTQTKKPLIRNRVIQVQYHAKLVPGPGGAPMTAPPYHDIESCEDLEQKYGREKFQRLHEAAVAPKPNPLNRKLIEAGLAAMTVEQLKGLAEENEISFEPKATKEELVHLLLTAGVS